MFHRSLLAVTAVFVLAACASGSTLVLEPPKTTERFSDAKLVAATPTVAVDSELASYFGTSLDNKLFTDEMPFNRGEGLTIQYRFLQFDEGNRAARYVVGMGAGKGEITIEVLFMNGAGEELSRINVGGEILMGIAGGSIKQALDRAATEAAEYAKTNFKG